MTREFNTSYWWEQTLEQYVLEHCETMEIVLLAEESTYWEDALNFVEKNADVQLKFLSEKQLNWAEKIKNDLEGTI